jgi:hypothetical protein
MMRELREMEKEQGSCRWLQAFFYRFLIRGNNQAAWLLGALCWGGLPTMFPERRA